MRSARFIIRQKKQKKQNIETVCVDEMTGIQALQRIAPDHAMLPGQPQRIEYEYKRHGTQCLLAAMNVVTGNILGDCREHRKETDFIEFIQMLDVQFSGCAQLRIVLDNLNTHQSASLVEYVAARIGYTGDLGVKGVSGILKDQQSRAEFLSDSTHCIAFYYTPKHSSWMNQIEVWFGIIARKVIRRGNFKSTQELNDKLMAFIDYFNQTMAKPFRWRYSRETLKA